MPKNLGINMEMIVAWVLWSYTLHLDVHLPMATLNFS
jgi:hypothetical protein